MQSLARATRPIPQDARIMQGCIACDSATHQASQVPTITQRIAATMAEASQCSSSDGMSCH